MDEEKQKMFNYIREKIKEGDEETIHFVMTQARNITSYIIKKSEQDLGKVKDTKKPKDIWDSLLSTKNAKEKGQE